MAEYWDEDLTGYDLKKTHPMRTYDKDAAEKRIAWCEKFFGHPLSEERKERIRKCFVYVGDDKEEPKD